MQARELGARVFVKLGSVRESMDGPARDGWRGKMGGTHREGTETSRGDRGRLRRQGAAAVLVPSAEVDVGPTFPVSPHWCSLLLPHKPLTHQMTFLSSSTENGRERGEEGRTEGGEWV